jgi:hypothetical protein
MDTLKKSLPVIRQELDLSQTAIDFLSQSPTFPFSLPMLETRLQEFADRLRMLRSIAEVGERMGVLYPLIGGFHEPYKILLVLQNSGELRPTGGFIGSVMLATLSEGKVASLELKDVYELDGQLKGHIDPPGPIATILNQEHWFLRDANWYPDFAKSGDAIRKFYEKETGETLDSVIGVTSSLFVSLLKVAGPVDLPGYNDRISADNFYMKSIAYTQADFFPGSTQKKDFLGSLLQGMLTKLQKNPSTSLVLLTTLTHALTSRDIQWYAVVPSVQYLLNQYGWGGSVPAADSCPSSVLENPCFFSYLAVNEANLGVNKVNPYVSRIQSRTLTINENGGIEESVTRRIRNASGEGKSYIAYLRFLYPLNARVTSVTVDGKIVQAVGTKTRPSLPWGETEVGAPGLTSTNIAFEVPAGSEKIVSLSYTHNPTFQFQGQTGFLSIYEQKQAGVDSIEETVRVTYPATWNLTEIGKGSSLVANPGVVEYNTTLTRDAEMTFTLVH